MAAYFSLPVPALLLLLLAAVAQAQWNPDCITTPVGFATGTTGGQGGRVLVPTTLQELQQYLLGNVPRIVYLDQTFDFAAVGQTLQGPGCIFQACGTGFQYCLQTSAGTCAGRQNATVTYNSAGVTPLIVGSNISIIGRNGKGVLRGKGLVIQNASNVIIRDISIVEINPAVIWGGDAITFDQVDKVWIHKVTIKNIGRQHLVTNQKVNNGITVSSCTFDGNTPFSAYCDGAHYWNWIFWGTDDKITLINNRVVYTSGRLPHAGGWTNAKSFVHMIRNRFETNTHVAIEPNSGSRILAEGNLYSKMYMVVENKHEGGFLFNVNTPAEATQCQASLGTACLANQYANGTTVMTRADAEALTMAGTFRAAVNAARAAAASCPL